jgi:hypothetical protein
MSHPKYLVQKPNYGFHNGNMHAKSVDTFRAHIQSKTGDTLFVGRILSKNNETHEAIILLDGAKTPVPINLGNYAGSSSAFMANTVYYRRVA